LDGIVEMDETFFNVSYKGSRKMPRVAHRRGGEIHKSGMSVDKVCVPCAVNRSGLSIAKVANWGRLSCTDVCKIYTGRIDSGAIMVTDKMNSYIRFAKENNIQLIQLETNLTRKGIYNVQRINNYHNLLKRFMRKFNGVATKYLNNYLIWNNFINYSKETIAENIGY